LVGKSNPVIVVVEFKVGSDPKFEVISSEVVPACWSPGQLSFVNENCLVGNAVYKEPRKLGIIYCSNRKSIIFKLDLQNADKKFEILSSDNDVSAKCPRVWNDTLVWLERDLTRDPNLFMGPHQTCFRLMKLDLGCPGAKPVEVVGSSSRAINIGTGKD
jgi:acylaminoacyl-peptidase